ncbi:MAG: LptF/LptG family permease [Gammaproteobacteria bacterium]|nr:LptF/LptG family permease [Gammaproteobacteria bacterium]
MILYKYFLKNLITYLFFILCVFTVIFLSVSYFHFVGEAALAKINPNDIAKIMVTEIPVLLQPILPLGFFLTILLVLRKMYATNEILTMYASGMSAIKLFLPIITLCVILVFFSSYIELYIFPIANTKRIHLFEDSIHKVAFDKVFPKQFNELAPDRIMYIDKKITQPKKLEGIFFSYLMPDKQNALSYDVIVAKSLEEQVLPDKSKFLVFTDGVRYTAKLSNLQSLMIKFNKFGVRLSTPSYKLEDWPGCMKTLELYFLSKVNRFAAAELHWRFSIPLSIINLTFFALALNKGRIQSYQKPISTFYPLLIYLIYVNVLLGGVSLIKTGLLNKNVGLWAVHGAMFLFGIISMRYRPE